MDLGPFLMLAVKLESNKSRSIDFGLFELCWLAVLVNTRFAFTQLCIIVVVFI